MWFQVNFKLIIKSLRLFSSSAFGDSDTIRKCTTIQWVRVNSGDSSQPWKFQIGSQFKLELLDSLSLTQENGTKLVENEGKLRARQSNRAESPWRDFWKLQMPISQDGQRFRWSLHFRCVPSKESITKEPWTLAMKITIRVENQCSVRATEHLPDSQEERIEAFVHK